MKYNLNYKYSEVQLIIFIVKMTRTKAVAKKSSEKPGKKNLHVQKIARKSAPVTTGVRKYRFKPGTVALREIKKYQRSTELLIQKAPFQRKGISRSM